MYDFIVVGCGLSGAVMANRIRDAGYSCLIIEKRQHIAGNAFTDIIDDIQIHKYGPHIFHTSNETVWDFVNQYSKFNRYINSPLVNYRGQIYNLPFNMNTFNKLWGVVTPQQAQLEIERQRAAYYVKDPKNLEEQALCLVGRDIYEKLICGYTEKQWGRSCNMLPPSIIKRVPLRFTYDNNYFNDIYQGIPINGYTTLVEKMIDGIKVEINTDFLNDRPMWIDAAKVIIYTGPIDAYFDYCFGKLQYRSLRFETESLNTSNFQGNAVINYTDREAPFTRIIEHKHFLFGNQKSTVISREYSVECTPGEEPCYPINNFVNNQLYLKYHIYAEKERNVFFIGRLAEYRYLDMDQVIFNAIEKSSKESILAMLERSKKE